MYCVATFLAHISTLVKLSSTLRRPLELDPVGAVMASQYFATTHAISLLGTMKNSKGPSRTKSARRR